MINEDLMRSFRQYKKQIEIGHIKISFFKKILLSLFFFILFFTFPITFFYKKKNKDFIYIFPFSNKEPMKSIVSKLQTIPNSKIIIRPNSFKVVPLNLYKDYLIFLLNNPQWTISNLDFFGALALKISKYYGYKVKYGCSKLLLFQEYSFYISYLTYLFEKDNGKLYGLMHGIPGEEASFFRFSKFFVWSKYFKNYYVNNNADVKQFKIVGSIVHNNLREKYIVEGREKYDIVYALQGDLYSNYKYKVMILELLEELKNDLKYKIAIKEHPIYRDTLPTHNFDILNNSSYEILFSSKLIISQFSTMLYDAKSLNKGAFALLPKEKIELVSYLEDEEIGFSKDESYKKIIHLIKANKENNFKVDDGINPLERIKNEIC